MHKRRWKLTVDEHSLSSTDREFMAESYKHIKYLNKIASKAKKDVAAIFKNEVAQLRMNLTDDFAYRFYNVTVALGPHKLTKLFSVYPEQNDLAMLKNDLLRSLSKGRAEKRSRHKIEREFQGMHYLMTAPRTKLPKIRYDERGNPFAVGEDKILPDLKGGGAVFEKSGAILELLKSEEYRNRIRRAKKPYDKANYVGVELEIVTKIDRDRLNELFIDAKLAGNVYVKSDGSIRTEAAGDVAHEVTLIGKEPSINDIINRVCAVLRKPEVGAYVNNSCGMHVHIDMRNRNPEKCFANFKAALPVLANMVPPDRVDSDHGRRYCSLDTSATLADAVERQARYRAVNGYAYQTHKTIEIRLHSGTTNATKINHWVNLLTCIANHGETVKETIYSPTELQTKFGFDTKLLEYIEMRTKKFSDRTWDTRKDHFTEISA